MSQTLSHLLGAGEPMFSIAVRRMEQATGNQGTDVRLTADIAAKAHMAIRSLGLDGRDITGRELYYALYDLALRHDEFMARRLGADDPQDVMDILRRIRIASQNVSVPRRVWVMKHSVMKRLLKATPPKSTMKALGYRSQDSLLKREPVGLIVAAARLVETEAWQRSFVQRYKALQPHDFEIREIEIFQPDSTRWRELSKPYMYRTHHNLTHLKELGTIVVLPLPVERLAGVTLAVFPYVLHYMNELRLYSAFFKLQQVRAEFGAIVARTIADDPSDHATFAGYPIHWRIISRHFGARAVLLPEMFEPHLAMEDMQWQKAEATLYDLEPALQFWHNLDYVGVLRDGQPVSMALQDVIACVVNQLPYERRAVGRMRQSLWNELHQRYIAHPVAEAHVLRQLAATSDSTAADMMELLSMERM